MRTTLGFLLALFAVSCASAKEPDRMVDIGGGRRLHLHCVGSGSPTVIFESGLAEGFYVWALLQDDVGKRYRACSYDRSGVGFSDPDPDYSSRSVATLNADLHALLQRSGEPAPYILVGHSLGGTLVRRYAQKHPGEVAALVLVDSAHEDARRQGHPEIEKAVQKRLAARAEQLKAWHASGKFEEMDYDDRVPERLVRMVKPRSASAAWWDARWAENHLPDMDQPPAERRLDVPIVVIVATKYVPPPPDFPEEPWKENHRRKLDRAKELASRSARSKLVLVETDHSAQLGDPRAVIDAIDAAIALTR